MEQQNAKFEGWALIELFGHGHEAGYVTTQYYGDKAMFQVDVPEIPARQETLDRPRWIEDALAPVGSVVEATPIPGRTRLVNPGAVYSMNPATEDAVRAAIARSERREIKVISMPESAQLSSGSSWQPGDPDPAEDGDNDVEMDDDDEPNPDDI